MVIEREVHGDVVVLRMAHGKVNALDLELLTALTAALDELAAGGPPLVLTGRGTAFSAGVDLRRIVTEPPGYGDQYLHALSAAFSTLFRHPGPAVAAVNGHAIAGGFVLAAACEHRVVSEGAARLGLSELQVGVPFPTSAVEIVRHAVGTPAASRLALSAELVDPQAALERQLVHEVVPPDALLGTAIARAAQRADRGLEAYRMTKR
jgi:enoyl-CoA hydratase